LLPFKKSLLQRRAGLVANTSVILASGVSSVVRLGQKSINFADDERGSASPSAFLSAFLGLSQPVSSKANNVGIDIGFDSTGDSSVAGDSEKLVSGRIGGIIGNNKRSSTVSLAGSLCSFTGANVLILIKVRIDFTAVIVVNKWNTNPQKGLSHRAAFSGSITSNIDLISIIGIIFSKSNFVDGGGIVEAMSETKKGDIIENSAAIGKLIGVFGVDNGRDGEGDEGIVDVHSSIVDLDIKGKSKIGGILQAMGSGRNVISVNDLTVAKNACRMDLESDKIWKLSSASDCTTEDSSSGLSAGDKSKEENEGEDDGLHVATGRKDELVLEG